MKTAWTFSKIRSASDYGILGNTHTYTHNMKPEEKIIRFVDNVVLPNASPLPGVPEELRDGNYASEGWYSWTAIPSTINNDDLNIISDQIGFRFPQLFKEYFAYKVILDGDFGLVRFPDMSPSDVLKGLRTQLELYYQFEFFKDASLVPFAQEGNDGGPLCFKIDEPTEDGDFPIYFIDHERLKEDGYKGVKRWDSFSGMLQDIEADIMRYR